MIERYPSLSLNDLLNMLPNRRVMAPSVQEMQNLNLRGAFREVTGGVRNVDQLNNAFGIALVIDDIALSNNANMQSRNPGIYGVGNANLSVAPGDYNLSGDRPVSGLGYSGESAFGGIDLRQIPTENIERLEVISGVAPVRYGDISDGAIIVERQAGRTPAFVRIQSRENATSYGFSKGMMISPRWGNVNVDMSYVNSFADNRDKLKQYNRLSSSLIWTTNYGALDRWKQTLSVSYNKILDGVNKDDDDPLSTIVRYGSWNLNASSRISYQPDSEVFKRFALNLGIQTSHQGSYREYYYNDSYVLYTDTLETGIVEGKYASGQYTAIDNVDGRPLNLTARIETNAIAYTNSLAHHINMGATADYSMNRGLGRLSDPLRPLKHLGAYNERYYDFSLIHPVWNFGIYVDDRMNISLWERPLSVTAGVRWDIQNGHQSLSPRTNINYALHEHLNIGMAYGLAFKAPSLAHLYPGPTFREIILLNAYNGRVNESTSRIYVHRHDPPNSHLKAQFSQTTELTMRWKKNKHSISFNAFFKENRNGINSNTDDFVVALPQYEAIPVAGQKPTVNIIGERMYLLNSVTMRNSNHRNNIGFELMYGSPRISPIYTSFVFAGGATIAYSLDNFSSRKSLNTNGTNPNDIITGYYNPINRKSYFSNGRISSVTHFPKLRLVMDLTADAQFLNYTKLDRSEYEPIGFLRRSLEYVEIKSFDIENAEHRL
ncbi:MAG TPA: TonB-dependent receptor, partial [Sphingobacterium sp.]|nr:TonB-dependent receptor [Sphingobacterium sp.]